MRSNFYLSERILRAVQCSGGLIVSHVANAQHLHRCEERLARVRERNSGVMRVLLRY